MSQVTVVSCYYKIKSKQPVEYYLMWIKNFMWINDNSPLFNTIIFCNKESYYIMTNLYPEHERRTYIICELDNFKVNVIDWKFQLTLDSEKYHTTDLYKIWNEKPFFLKRAIEKNVYNTEYFFWMDIGSFRDVNRLSDFIYFPMVNKFTDKLCVQLINDFTQTHKTDICIDDKRFEGKNNDFIAGTFLFGHKNLLLKYSDLYYEMLSTFPFFKGKDQILINFLVLRHPLLFNVIKSVSENGYDPWFFFHYYFLSNKQYYEK